ncbi:MAG: OmpH family outer membrane protein [Bacteroidaceae bacterium]|nr:OmpH family outer membrane protein [Bacteroidaceae bacterium]
MVNKQTFIGAFFVAVSVSLLTGCTYFSKSETNSKEDYIQESYVVPEGGLKIAYVDVDTLLVHYAFFNDLTEEMLRKEENSRILLNEQAQKVQAEYDEYQRKLNNNVFSSQARAESERKRILQLRQDWQDLNVKLTNEIAAAQEKNNAVLSESIQVFIKKYNKSHGFNLILTKSGDNILFADKALDITEEVLEGLNADYLDNQN